MQAMSTMSRTLSVAFVVVFSLAPARDVKAQDGVAGLLEQARVADPKQALEHLRKAVRLLEAQSDMASEERQELVKRLAAVLEARAPTPAEFTFLLGPKLRKQVFRQVCYRRYIEYWLIEMPVRLQVTYDYRKGEDPRVTTIRPLTNEN